MIFNYPVKRLNHLTEISPSLRTPLASLRTPLGCTWGRSGFRVTEGEGYFEGAERLKNLLKITERADIIILDGKQDSCCIFFIMIYNLEIDIFTFNLNRKNYKSFLYILLK